MKRILWSAWIIISAFAFAQTPAPARPKIMGIDHVAFYTSSPDANRRLYEDVLGLASSGAIEPGQSQTFMIGTKEPGMQWVGYSSAIDTKVNSRMDHVALRTENCAALRAYLVAHGIKVPDSVKRQKSGSHILTVMDPEGHKIEFVELAGETKHTAAWHTDPLSRHIIHAGFIVHDRAAEDHFYKDILGFHLYWYGGMQPDSTDWVAMQVPDGTDWLEYMLNQPADPDQELAGVMNHISLGVKDMKATQAKLESRGFKADDRERAQMGRDGKWQLNVYDPDQTRIELMEFKPVEKPCCSEFQGPHPSE